MLQNKGILGHLFNQGFVDSLETAYESVAKSEVKVSVLNAATEPWLQLPLTESRSVKRNLLRVHHVCFAQSC